MDLFDKVYSAGLRLHSILFETKFGLVALDGLICLPLRLTSYLGEVSLQLQESIVSELVQSVGFICDLLPSLCHRLL